MRILLTEDDEELAALTAKNLKTHGFVVDVASTKEDTLRLFEENGEYDAVVLDLILPDGDGRELLDTLKSIAPTTPVLALTGRDSEADRVGGIMAGFDDYLTKPFSHHELAARVRVLCRSSPVLPDETLKIGPLKINPKNQSVTKRGKPIKLTLNEFRLLYHLVENRGRSVSTEELIGTVWDMNSLSEVGKVFTTVSRLRKKIGDEKKSLIQNHKKGYLIK